MRGATNEGRLLFRPILWSLVHRDFFKLFEDSLFSAIITISKISCLNMRDQTCNSSIEFKLFSFFFHSISKIRSLIGSLEKWCD